MDWTQIITTAITVIGGAITAYIGVAVKRHAGKNDEILARMEKMGGQLSELGQQSRTHDAQLQKIDDRLEGLEQQSHAHDTQLQKLDEHLETQQTKLDTIEKRLKDEESANIIQQSQLSKITSELEDNNLRTMRLDLLHAIESDPDNQMVIIDLAQKYFVEMKGNCYMSKIFQEWADEHRVNIASIFNKG